MEELNFENGDQSALIDLTADIVAAYVSNNVIPSTDLPVLITDIHVALQKIQQGEKVVKADAPVPAVSVRKSIMPDYIICLEDGKKYKSLKRHLRTQYNLTPEEYREKWGLPYDYPMVAPNYAKARSRLAREMGLGRKPGNKIKKKK